jgi:hypothetical protein
VAVYLDVDYHPSHVKLQWSTWNWYYVTLHKICIRFTHFFSMCNRIMRQHPPSVEEKLTVSVPFSATCTMLKTAPLYFWHQSASLCDNSARIPIIGFHKLCWKYFTQTCIKVSIFI